MNFLTKTLGSFTGSSIPYTIGEKLDNQTSIWTISHGTSNKDNSKVTIFQCSKTENHPDVVNLARNCFLKTKLVKFPGIIHTIEFIENDSYYYIITEPVTTLAEYLINEEDNIDENILLLGIHNISKTMSFINKDCNYFHGNLNLHSVYVDISGNWKLFGFELMTNLTSDPDQPFYRYSNYLFTNVIRNTLEDQFRDHDLIRKGPFKYDSLRFAILIYQLFNGTISSLDQLNTPNIPKSLVPGFKRLAANFSTRITIDNFFKNGESTFFKNNSLISFSHELDEIKFKNESEKLQFLNELSMSLSALTLPRGWMEYRILPELVNQFNNNLTSKTEDEELRAKQQQNLATILSNILKFSENLSDESFNNYLKPTILKAFTLPDRSIRVNLLANLSKIVPKLNSREIQDRIFTNLMTGFQDTNATIREETVKSVILIADKLTDRQLNNDLLRHLAKSQIDPQPSIRTNTIIVLCKISPSLSKSSRANVLIVALSKSLKDPFVPCKLNGLVAFNSCIDFFDPEVCCTKILGVITACLLDKSYKVREEAKKCFENYMKKINEAADQLPKIDEPVEDMIDSNGNKLAYDAMTANKSSSSINLGFGWNVVNKLTSSIGGQLDNEFTTSTPDLTRNGTPDIRPVVTKKPIQQEQFGDWDDGEDLDIDDSWDSNEPEEVTNSTAKLTLKDEDNWGFGTTTRTSKPAVVPRSKPVTTSRTPIPRATATQKTTVGKKTSSLQLNKKKPSTTLNLNLKIEDEEDGWGNDGW